jgi:hypothetical protein
VKNNLAIFNFNAEVLAKKRNTVYVAIFARNAGEVAKM